VFILASFSGVRAEELYHKSMPLMHTFVEIKACGDNQTPAIIDETFGEISRINDLLNNYDPSSDVSAINTAAGGQAVTISAETYSALSDAQQYARLSNGAFDFTVAPLISLWGFNHEYPGIQGPEPDAERIAQVRQLVDYRALVLKRLPGRATARLKRTGMSIDTGAFAKGAAADAAIAYLQAKGIQRALVAAGGTIRAIGQKPDGKPWQIGIRHPRNENSFLTVIELHDQSVSTSGDYETFYYKAGKRRSHIIDPRTGMPVSTLQSVTVIAPNGSASDSLSTALFVLGPQKGLRLIEEKKGFEALIVTAGGKVVYSKGWPQKTIIY
jgi:thiamine biosynthesis lipoprotein